jgi:hypothetical protein
MCNVVMKRCHPMQNKVHYHHQCTLCLRQALSKYTTKTVSWYQPRQHLSSVVSRRRWQALSGATSWHSCLTVCALALVARQQRFSRRSGCWTPGFRLQSACERQALGVALAAHRYRSLIAGGPRRLHRKRTYQGPWSCLWFATTGPLSCNLCSDEQISSGRQLPWGSAE